MSDPVELEPKEYVPTVQFLRQIEFLKDVPDDELRDVLLSLQKQKFPPNKTILFQGEIGNRMFIIRQGSVVIYTKSRGEKLQLAELTPPLYFGEISLLRPLSATATAKSGDQGAELLILTYEAFTDLSKKFPEMGKKIQQTIESRLAAKKKAKESDEDPSASATSSAG